VVEQALIVMGVMGVLAVIATGAVAALAVRGLRRRYRTVQQRIRVAHASAVRLRRSRSAPMSAVVAAAGSPGWWVVQNRRHRMWRAVSSAEHAVGVARRSDVAVGDLPALTDQLREAAHRADSVLRASVGRGSLGKEDRANCELIAADIQRAALSSLRIASQAETDPFVSAVQIEVAALAAGIRAAHG
jgi:Tfp pilus assembly protein FimT